MDILIRFYTGTKFLVMCFSIKVLLVNNYDHVTENPNTTEQLALTISILT